MSSYAFLVGRPDKKPLFNHGGGDNEIAYATDWVPIGWLAMFEPRDVQVVEEPEDSDTYDPETKTRCPTLIRRRDTALEVLRRRSERLGKLLPPHLQAQLHGLEAAVSASPLHYVQCVVTDLDMFVSHPGSEKMLRDLVATMDGDNVKQWRNMLSMVDTDLGKDLTKVQFSEMTGVAAVVGYLPEKYSVSLGATKESVAKTMPIPKPVPAKKPWWKFW
jgi:hypothetical protein